MPIGRQRTDRLADFGVLKERLVNFIRRRQGRQGSGPPDLTDAVQREVLVATILRILFPACVPVI
jgi:hypothetical protein